MSLLRNTRFLKGILIYQRCNVTKKIYNNFNSLPLFANAVDFSDKTALHDGVGSYTFGSIFESATELSEVISKKLDGKTDERVLFLCSNDVNYVVTLWAIWLSGQIAVPLSPLHPVKILQYYAQDTSCKLLVTTPQHQELMKEISETTKTELYTIDSETQKKTAERKHLNSKNLQVKPLPEFYEKSNAFILYTSGTTGNPKGVVLSHHNLLVQTNTLLQAWKWSPNDVILHTLPLHHVHGTVNALFCPLRIGAKTVMLPKFSPEEVWSHLLGTNKTSNEDMTVFMAVPTIYSKLIEYYENNLKNQKDNIRNRLKNKVRLMVSGSAPLPVPLYQKWLEISGHKLLERYGMTEIGMGLSNEYESDREPGYVGVPLPGISVRISEKTNDNYTTLLECKNENGNVVLNPISDRDVQGELLVKGEGIFKEYFNKPEATKKEFTEDGWFKTGDMCEYVSEKNRFRILGRSSVDIIKSGGYKISALQIETILLAHPDIKECAVLGVSDEVWGERVAAVVVIRSGASLTLDQLKEWAKDKLPKYALPSLLKTVEDIPKNAMGKVNKKELKSKVL